MKAFKWSSSGVFLLLGICYFVTAAAGLSLAFVHPSATAVWPPSGIALAAFLVFGYRIWPGIFAGAFLVNLWINVSAGTSPLFSSVAIAFCIAIGNTLEPLSGAFLINRYAHGKNCFERTLDIFKYILLAGIVSTVVSATVGVLSLSTGGMAPWEKLSSIWLTWWMGDCAGILVVAPPLLLSRGAPDLQWTPMRIAEVLVLFLMVSLAGQIVFGGWFPGETKSYPIEYVVMPLILYSALRFGLRETSLATLLLAVLAVVGSKRGYGPFVREDPNESLLLLQMFMATLSISGLLLSSVVSERHRIQVELRESEQRFRQLAENIPQVFWMTDSVSGNLIYISPTYEVMWGRSRESLHQDPKSFLEAIHPDDRKRVEKCMEQQAQGQATREEYRLVHQDGSIRWVLDRGFPVKDKNGVVCRIAGIVEDITERKSASEILARRAEDLARSNAELEQFAYVASHDLQEPLRMVVSYMQLLEKRFKGKLDPKADQYIYYAVDGSKRMQNMIRGLLSYSRLGKSTENLSAVDFGNVLEAVRLNLKRAIDDANAKITCSTMPVIRGDSTQFIQLFQNLIENAIKFKGVASPRVQVSAQSRDGEWLFSVQDNGIGIEHGLQPRIFQLFQRLHEREKYPGSGLGLAIAKRIVERYGGRIWLESAPGSGTTFLFTLPKADGDVRS